MFEKIKEFIIEERWEYDFELKYETSLQDDLKIFGDDASEILLKFCQKFNVKFDKFKFDDYFRPEPSWIDSFGSESGYKKLTLRDLVNAANNGILI